MSTLKYPLLPYSLSVWNHLKKYGDAECLLERIRWNPQQVRSDKVMQALRNAMLAHPIFWAEFDDEGKHYPGKCENVLNGPFHQVKTGECDSDAYVEIRVNRLLGDGISRLIFAEDFCRALAGLPIEPDDYWKYLESVENHKQDPSYLRHGVELKDEFGRVDYPLAPKEDTDLSSSKTNGILQVDLRIFQDQVADFIDSWKLSLNGLMVLSTAMAIMDMENSDKAGMTWAYDGRETEQEQRIFGSLHRDVPICIKRAEIKDMIRQTRTALRRGIAHSDYPFTLTSPADSPWHKAVNVVVEPAWDNAKSQIPEGLHIEDDYTWSAMSYLDVEVFDNPLRMQLRYDAACYTEQRMLQFGEQIKENIKNMLRQHNVPRA